MKQILPNIFAVEVPSKSKMESLGCFSPEKDVRWGKSKICHEDFLTFYSEHTSLGNGNIYNVPIGFDFEILGTVTKDTIDFDVQPYIKVRKTNGVYIQYLKFKDYTTKNKHPFFKASDSFRSALSAAGIYFENPYGEKEPEFNPECCGNWLPDKNNALYCCGRPNPSEEIYTQWTLWCAAQSKIVSKIVILKKI